MKKVCIFVALLTVAFAATVYAQPKLDLKISGFIDYNTYWFKNVGSQTTENSWGTIGLAVADKTQAYSTARSRLKFDAKYGKELAGTILFEMDGTFGNYDGTRNAYGYWSGDRASVEVKNVYFDVAIPYYGVPVPQTLRVGLQPFAIRDDIFMYTDGPGITYGLKPDPVTVNLYWGKGIEGREYQSDDTDFYGIQGYGKLGGHTIGGFVWHMNSNNYPMPISGYAAPTNRADFTWFGAYADGKIGPVSYTADFIYDNGEVEQRNGVGLDDVDYSGWMARIKGQYNWECFEFGGGLSYASGADLNDLGGVRTGLPGVGVDKVKQFIIPPGAEPGVDRANGFGAIVYGSPFIRSEPRLTSDRYNTVNVSDHGGLWNARLYAGYNVTKWYKVILQGMYVGDTVKHGNQFGTALKADGSFEDDSDVGWEFALSNTFQVYPNLKFNVVGGYLIAGDALEYYDTATGTNEDPDNPWTILTQMQYSF